MFKKINHFIIRFFLSTITLLIINMVCIQFNFTIPFNMFTILLLTCLGIPGLIVAIIIKTLL